MRALWCRTDQIALIDASLKKLNVSGASLKVGANSDGFGAL